VLFKRCSTLLKSVIISFIPMKIVRVDMFAKNRSGKDAYDIAKEYDQEHVAQYLEQRMNE